ncbi:MAG TPA: DUF2784 domain-containing protein [Thermoanaerobaculia bacterium]|nr:DUF2784 domain-containing protein [Thermoanaerobaculia bacterium]
MLYRILADLVATLHFLFVLFVIFGGLLVLRHPRLAVIHLPTAVWGAAIEFANWVCPLTPLENALRRRGGEQGYAGGFVEHYLLPILYPAGLTRGVQIFLGVAVIAINAFIYWKVAQRLRSGA